MKEKFIFKNRGSIEKLDKYIDEHRDDIRMMIVSPEIFYSFLEYYETSDYREKDDLMEERMKYRGVRMVRDNMSPTSRLYFVRKSESVDFNMPCICGIYQDETHELK